MENRIYYGEYSLKHWIDMLLKKKITLPEYQRSFVWDEKAVKRFIKSLKEKQFIPPVTIAHYKIENDDNETNIILDGQQRLTSLLLATIESFPDKSKFEKAENVTKSEDDSDEDSEKNIPIKWTFNQLLKLGNNIKSIKNKVSDSDEYHTLKIDDKINEDFLENTFLGFSYIVPDSDKKDEVQKSFSKTFREINYLGKFLSAQESRRSLYFMNDKYKDFLDGKIENDDVLSSLTINENMKSNKIDFVRYLSILSQYKAAQEDSGSVLKYYSSYASREAFYVDYVSFIINIEQESHEEKFNGFSMEVTFPNECWKERFKTLKTKTAELKEINLKKEKTKSNFDSWIDADYYLFGLVYYVLFEDLKVNLADSLIKELQSAIEEKRKDTSYSRSPNKLGNLRERLNDSIQIYKKHITE